MFWPSQMWVPVKEKIFTLGHASIDENLILKLMILIIIINLPNATSFKIEAFARPGYFSLISLFSYNFIKIKEKVRNVYKLFALIYISFIHFLLSTSSSFISSSTFCS